MARHPSRSPILPGMEGAAQIAPTQRPPAKASFTHTYDKPGTYFASVRVRSTRSAKNDDIFTQVRNIARVKIVVE